LIDGVSAREIFINEKVDQDDSSVAAVKQFTFARDSDVLYLRVLKLLRIGLNLRLTTPKACQRIDIDVSTNVHVCPPASMRRHYRPQADNLSGASLQKKSAVLTHGLQGDKGLHLQRRCHQWGEFRFADNRGRSFDTC
jgi:hypothetical protein